MIYDDETGKGRPRFEKKCRHCGRAEGYYIRIRYSGVSNYFLDDDGDVTDNSEFYENSLWREYKMKYCSYCNKVIGQMGKK